VSPYLSVYIDVINVSGHRLSTAEIESALILHKGVAETAGSILCSAYRIPFRWREFAIVIGTADDLTGQAVHAFVTLKPYVLLLLSKPLGSGRIISIVVNSNMTPMTNPVWWRSSFFKCVRLLAPSPPPRRSTSSAICPRRVLERRVLLLLHFLGMNRYWQLVIFRTDYEAYHAQNRGGRRRSIRRSQHSCGTGDRGCD